MAKKKQQQKPKVQERSLDVEKTLNQSTEMLQKFAKPVVDFIAMVTPHIIKACSGMWATYKALPKTEVQLLTGIILCFFGGLYPVTFAAVQAAEHGGRKKVVEALTIISEEALIIIEESKKDDLKDDNKNGIADVKEIDSTHYAIRKINLVMTKMDPKKVDAAIASIYLVWLSVVAVLMVQFARTISMALTMSVFMMKPVNRYITPAVALAVPNEYQKWIPVVLVWVVKSIAISIAWFIQTLQSAVTSAMYGGHIMADALLHICVKRGWTLGGWITDDLDKTYADEIIMYIFAALGILFQFMMQFDMPFPFSLILWPVELFEYYLKW
eukprot:CAMPEP_0194146622 /NCGR_PEP_ID=MMETSP0152-20130528/21114_1 /TAXON_ID=1049557 /ORGANISM="Thalassiothrix antarctica, Strain L6-D1" /LENGTH=326 /DNA_ID=CAMNT_0038847183 /DNA_START=103 /DNA_END=1080 /DNA_ORIENTATION=+